MGSGFPTLLYKEVLRFWRVSLQTIFAPVLTSILYLFVFSHALSRHVDVYEGVSYTAFLVPGLVMMSMLQNAFSNSSSSLIQAKLTGNLVYILLPPISNLEFFGAYFLSSVLRGVVVGAAMWVATFIFVAPSVFSVVWVLVFALLGCGVFGVLGLIAGIWAEKFDQLASFQNFLIMPLTFLSGVFYSIHSLPPFWFDVSRFNPVFYMIDGFRFGFFGASDVEIWRSFWIILAVFLVLTAIALGMLKSGYKLREK